jgi:predicted amidophosphoribosyltransferase
VSLVIDLIAAAVLVGMIVKERKPKVTINPVVSPMASSYQPARFCTGCGQELHDNAAFCRNCGQTVGRTLNGDVPLAGQRLQPMT